MNFPKLSDLASKKKMSSLIDKTLKFPEGLTEREKKLLQQYHQRRDNTRFA